MPSVSINVETYSYLRKSVWILYLRLGFAQLTLIAVVYDNLLLFAVVISALRKCFMKWFYSPLLSSFHFSPKFCINDPHKFTLNT